MEHTNLQKIKSLEELSEFTKNFLTSLPESEKATVVALSGDLGVGKTTFVQTLAKQLGIVEPVTSPTFTLMKRYISTDTKFSTLVHMDAYRLESETEVRPLRLDDIFKTQGVLFCIEWAEKISSVLPKETIFLTLSIDDAGVHTIQRESNQ